MTRLTQTTPHSPPTGHSRGRARRAVHGPAREARTRRSFDAMLASYIRELAAAGDSPDSPSSPTAPHAVEAR
jgi:hypothetical protein